MALVGMLWVCSALAPASFAAASESYEIAKWEAAAAMPIARHVIAMVRIPSTNSSSRGHVMVAGGHNNRYLDSVSIYDMDAGTWSGATAMPVDRGYFRMVHIPSVDGSGRGHVMVAGGYGTGIGNLNSTYMYHVDARTWSGPAIAMPVACYDFGMVHIPSVDGRGQVMVAGGHIGGVGYLDSVYMYDVDAGTWSGATAMPGKRFGFGMVHIPSVDGNGGGQVMAAGGSNTGGGNELDSVYMYDVDADTWSGPAAAMPVARRDFEMVHIPSVGGIGRGHVMAAGGRNTNGGNLASVYMYDVVAGTWSGPATALPVVRYDFGMVHIPSVDGNGRGQVMVAGGYNDVDRNLDSVYFSAPITTTATTTTTTTITTTSTTTATTTTTTITSSTTTTTTWLSVNAKCDPLVDACNAPEGLACSADVYECRYTAGTLESQICPACTDSVSCPQGSSAGVAVLAVLLVVSLAANGWFGYKNRSEVQMLRQQLAEQELGGGRRQTVEMVANPLARRSLGPQPGSGRAAAALPPQGQAAAALYAVPASDDTQTHVSVGPNYAPVYAVYAGSIPPTPVSASAAGVPLDSDNYVLDTTA